MRDSDTFMAILEEGRKEGRLEEAKKVILLQGQKRFGPPAEAVRAALNAISDLERLEQLALWLSDVSSWQKLLESRPLSDEAFKDLILSLGQTYLDPPAKQLGQP